MKWCAALAVAVLPFEGSGAGRVGATQTAATARAFEAFIGPWEVGSGSQIDGVFIAVVTATDAALSPVRDTHVGVYHRGDGAESWAWFVADDAGNEFLSFDGRHLTLRAASRIDVVFDAARSRWTGTWSRDGRTAEVALERPHRPRGATANEFCGAWDEIDDDRPQLPGHPQPLNRLHVAESSDRQLTAWMDRPVVLGGRQYGERFRVITAASRRLEIEWVHAAGPSVRFAAQLSGDDTTLLGSWIRGVNGRVGLSAPTTSYRRVQPPPGGCS